MAVKESGKSYDWTIERQHTVGNPQIFINRDIALQRRMFWEAAIHTGIWVDYFECSSDKSDFYNDPNVLWKEAIRVPVIYDNMPNIKILKKFGWYTDDQEDQLGLIYFPMYIDWQTKELLNVRENSLVRVHYFGQNIPAEFRIMGKKLDSVYGVYWICSLAPERLDKFYFVEEKGFHFLKIKERGEFCEHETDLDGDGIHNEAIDDVEDTQTYEHGDYINNIEETDNTVDDYFDSIMYGDTENNRDFYNYKKSKDIIKGKNDQ